jgi:1-acyl-sn-glycerol-3-phosphate acyltransferase
MSFNPVTILKEKESPVGPEAGLDPLPVPTGPLDPLYKVWSVAFAYPAAFGLMAAAMVPSIPLAAVMPFERFQTKFPQPLMALVPYVTGSSLKVTYAAGFDPDRVSMFMMNHTSILDAHVALHAVPRAFCGIQHVHHFKLPFYGWLMRKGNGIGVEKGAAGQAQRVAEQVHDRAERGISVLGFPEGRRTQNGRILPFRRGMFLMARDGGLPVVPLCVRGLWGVLRRGEWVVRPGKIEVYVGPQIETRDLTDEQIGELADRFQRFTADFVERGVLGDPAALSVARS